MIDLGEVRKLLFESEVRSTRGEVMSEEYMLKQQYGISFTG